MLRDWSVLRRFNRSIWLSFGVWALANFGYIGVQDATLPADFTPNVVSLDKKRA